MKKIICLLICIIASIGLFSACDKSTDQGFLTDPPASSESTSTDGEDPADEGSDPDEDGGDEDSKTPENENPEQATEKKFWTKNY